MTAGMNLIHVTHEGWEQMGGIGTVLQGLITSQAFRKKVARNILVGPLPYADRWVSDAKHRLGEHAVRCIYSGMDNHDPDGFGAKLRPIEWAFGVKIVYGIRTFDTPGQTTSHNGDRDQVEAELLLIDVADPNKERLGAFKFMLHEKFGIGSTLYERGWDYEEWVRLAEPAYHALVALLPYAADPAWVIGHEFMGVPTALRCSLDTKRFRTAFHAHECSTARRIVERLPGHDVAFYPAMRAAINQGKFVDEVFGDQSDYSRHVLVNNSYRLNSILAVGQETAEELRFLSPKMNDGPVRVCYNAVPAQTLTSADVQRSRGMMNDWLKTVIGFIPDYVFTHVTRPVPSKGIWRDFMTLETLAPMLAKEGKTAAYVLLTCGANPRTTEQIDAMAREYHWPANHYQWGADLQGPETDLYARLQASQTTINSAVAAAAPNSEHPPLRLLLVNQFGWSQARLGSACPAEMNFDDLRRATDVEFGLSVYEPFGISPLEPLHAGAICAISTISGCCGLVKRSMVEAGMETSRLVIPVDFTAPDPGATIRDMINMSAEHRREHERLSCTALAADLFKRLPRTAADTAAMLSEGQTLARHMGWDFVAEREFLANLR